MNEVEVTQADREAALSYLGWATPPNRRNYVSDRAPDLQRFTKTAQAFARHRTAIAEVEQLRMDLRENNQENETLLSRVEAAEAKLAEAVEALQLARNRMQRFALDLPGGDAFLAQEWAAEITAALAKLEPK
jgi:hypothetical protein